MTIYQFNQKYITIQKLLASQKFILLHLDPRPDVVRVPQGLKQQHTLNLKISRHFQGRLEIKPDMVKALLLFGGDYFDCHIPFEKIWGITGEDNQAIFWEEDMPEEIKKMRDSSINQPPAEEPKPIDPKPPKNGKRPNLKLVK